MDGLRWFFAATANLRSSIFRNRQGAQLAALAALALLCAGCGSRIDTPGGPSSVRPAGLAQAYDIPATASTVSNLQTPAGNWQSFGQAAPNYVDCTAPCGESTWEEIFNVVNPSQSGDATMFDLDPKVPYADALFTSGLIGANSPQIPDKDHSLLPTIHHFVYDAWFYVTAPQVTQSLEFDVSQWMDGIAGMTFGHQCNHLGDGDWDIWDNGNGHWVSTGDPCQFQAGWNHVTLEMERETDNDLLYQSIALNGTVYTLNKEYAPIAAPAGWWGVNVNYQMDSNYAGAPNTTYLDDFSVTYW